MEFQIKHVFAASNWATFQYESIGSKVYFWDFWVLTSESQCKGSNIPLLGNRWVDEERMRVQSDLLFVSGMASGHVKILCLPSSSRVSEYKWPPGNRRWSGMCLLNRCNVCEQWYLFSDGDVLIVSFLVVRSQKSQRTNCDVFAASEQSAIDLVADWHAADLLISRVLSSPVATSLIIKLSLSYVHPPLSYFLLHLMHVFQCWYREHNVIFTAAAEVHLCCGW